MNQNSQHRIYRRIDCVVFRKTAEEFGGLSNMAGGFPLLVNGIPILTSEALYQACRFPHMPEVQRLIIEQRSPMTAKMKGKPYRGKTRPDWDRLRVKIMRWCLRVKLAQNWSKFSELLLRTGDRPIVEDSRKDDFWGAKAVDGHTLAGTNALGRLLMELREEIKSVKHESLLRVEPLAIPDFLLDGKPISVVTARETSITLATTPSQFIEQISWDKGNLVLPPFQQSSLFDQHRPVETRPDVRRNIIDCLKPYPEYRDSGQAWIGAVPKDWPVMPNRALFSEVKDRNHPDEEMLSVTITKGIVQQKALLASSSKKDSSNLNKSAYKLVCPRDIAYNKMRAWQCAIGVSDYRGIISPAYVVIRLRGDHNPRYFHHLYRTPHFAKEAERWSYGITSDMWSLRPEHFKMIYSPLPSSDEQSAIVRFLDHINRRLEKTIQAKRKLISLLNEQKQTTIHRAVTRSLEVNVPLKPSGIPWLGDIPKHWELMKLKHISPQITVGIVIQPARLYVSKGVPCLRSLNISTGKISSDELVFISQESHQLNRKSKLNKGDVVIVRTGRTGVAVVVSDEFDGANCIDLLIVRKSTRLLSEYLLMYLRSHGAKSDIEFNSVGAIQAHYNTTTLANLRIPLPSIPEQEAILKGLEFDLAPTDAAIHRIEREVNLLREYRTRLIADVVTGKLDVRAAVRHLPKDIDEAEIPDTVDTLAMGTEEGDDLDMETAIKDAEV